MKPLHVRLFRLIIGLFLYSMGIVFSLKANIGYAPWEVFHVGLSKTTSISIGLASILVGAVIVAIVAAMGEKIGLGTVLNMIIIGVFVDVIMAFEVLPLMTSFPAGVAMLIAGMYMISIASYFYIDSGFGTGPRDSLMVLLKRKTGLPIGVCRGAIEGSALLVGWLLGGMVGLGTVISVFLIGFCIQTTFKLFRFEPANVKHQTLADTFANMTRRTALSEPMTEPEAEPELAMTAEGEKELEG